MKNILLEMIVETELSLDEFNYLFVEWIENNGWVTGGSMKVVDSNGDLVKKVSRN